MSRMMMEDAAPQPAENALESGGSGWFACPYCGVSQAMGTAECGSCGGLFEPLSRQATQNQMGPWQIRDEEAPFLPGRSYAAIRRMAQRGKLTADSIVRGPTTRQFWMAAGEVPGVAHLLGRCHSCKKSVGADSFSCDHCGAVFPNPDDRQQLGLAPLRMLPGQGSPALVAQAAAPAPAVAATRAGDDPPTAFAALARSAAQRATERPSEPAPLAPTGGAAAASAIAVTPTADIGVNDGVDATRSLRAANRRVSALRTVVLALVVVNVILVIVAAVVFFGGGISPGAAPGPVDAAEVSE